MNGTEVFVHLASNLSVENNYAAAGAAAIAGEGPPPPARYGFFSFARSGAMATDDNESLDSDDDLHCGRDALTDSFGWLIQGILASLAFALLILKRFCEPRRYRRQWITWFYDTSKQGFGAMVIHFANVFLAGLFQGDPCTWYIVSFLLDSSAGLFVIFICIRFSQFIAKQTGYSAFNFGEYDKPQWKAWLGQCVIYFLIMVLEKILITCLIQLQFWEEVFIFVRDILLSPIQDPKLELAIVVLVIPFVINAIMFWVVDNFLMRKRFKVKDESDDGAGGSGFGLIARRKVRYKRMDRREGSESEILLTTPDDEENGEVSIEMTMNISVHRHSTTAAVT